MLTSNQSAVREVAKGKVLVVDDERKIVDLVHAYLEREGYQVIDAFDGRQALEAFRREVPNLVVLDLMLPEIDGLEVCRTIRRESDVPVIMVTARSEETDKLVGLELGADDYITKPFSPRELVARAKAVLRRVATPRDSETAIQIGSLQLDVSRHEAVCHGNPLMLTPTEFKLLEVLARHPNRVYSRGQLLEVLRDEAYEGLERTVDTHIKNLRRKVEAVSKDEGCRIVTVFGVGYKLEGPGA